MKKSHACIECEHDRSTIGAGLKNVRVHPGALAALTHANDGESRGSRWRSGERSRDGLTGGIRGAETAR